MKKYAFVFVLIKLFFLFFLFFIVGTKISKASELPFYLRGKFLIQVEGVGQVWYVDTENGLRHYITKNRAHNFLLNSGKGISNRDLAKIPIAIDSRLVKQDSDGDGLDDRLERAIGTDPYDSDSDGDGYSDALELENGYDPLGKGKMSFDFSFVGRFSGDIFLQVENNGEAWYINPENKKRYYIHNEEALFDLIKYLGMGISNSDLEKITDAELINAQMIKNIKIDTSSGQRLHYYLGDISIGSFPISGGKATTPTPKGEYSIINKVLQAWSPYGLWMPYWMGLGTGRFGLHELPIWPNNYREGEDHLGIPVSHGCIRLGIGPAEFLYNWAEIGTKVYIY